MAAPWRKSNANFWCEYCRVWMADNAQVRAIHEAGAKHKDNVAHRLREMRLKAEQEKKEQADTAKALQDIETEAKRQYEADRAAQERARKAKLGTWEVHPETGYYYNSAQRWYYDKSSGMYYGGSPPDWTAQPPLPAEARFGGAPAQPQPSKQQPQPKSAAAVVSAAAAVPPTAVVTAGQRVGDIAHPLAQVGGYSMPTVGRIGGAKGVGFVNRDDNVAIGGSGGGGGGAKGVGVRPTGGAGSPAGGDGGGKRKRASGESTQATKSIEISKKVLSKEDEEFLRRREAARQRVQARTMAGYGLG